MDQPPYAVDPEDPRAPPQEIWDELGPMDRKRVEESLPSGVPRAARAMEGDPHREGRADALSTLRTFFRRVGRRVYLSSGLAVYYPDEPYFAPDLLAVFDTDTHARMKWVVSRERRGLDFVLEIHVIGDAGAEHERRLTRYAELGITEYFLFDRGRLGLRGFRLPDPEARAYEPITPQGGRLHSQVLGLDLTAHGNRLRFFHGAAPLLGTDEILTQAEARVDELTLEKAEAERIAEEQRRFGEREKERADRLDRVNARLQRELAEATRAGQGAGR